MSEPKYLKERVINNLKQARKNIEKTGRDDYARGSVHKLELVWIEDAIKYLEEK